MVRDRTTDGVRLAELLSSEIHGRESGPLGRLTVTDAADDVDPNEAGAFAYALDCDGARLATVRVHPDRTHVEFERSVERAADAGRDAELRVRPKAVDPPRTLLFVEDGAEVKRATDALAAVAEAVSESDGDR